MLLILHTAQQGKIFNDFYKNSYFSMGKFQLLYAMSFCSLFLFVAKQKEKVNRKRKTRYRYSNARMALQNQIDVVKSFAFHLFARYRASHTLAKICRTCTIYCAIVRLERLNALAFNDSHSNFASLCDAVRLAFFSFFGSFLSLLHAIKEKEMNIFCPHFYIENIS